MTVSISLNSNPAGLRGRRHLEQATESLRNSLGRLSSGMRINSASDDAAGLAMSGLLEADTRVYSQAIRNLSDGISILNIAEGALKEMLLISDRQRELAAQAATGTLSATQRESTVGEMNALVDEFNRIIKTTKFNDTKIFERTSDGINIQAGYGTAGVLSIEIADEMKIFGSSSLGDPDSFVAGYSPYSTASADFNGDGILDIAVGDNAGAGQKTVTILLGNGDGSFSTSQSLQTTNPQVYSIAAADFDGNGAIDLVTAHPFSASSQILWGNGDGTFSKGAVLSVGSSPQSVTTGDFNGDGYGDFATANVSGPNLTVYLGNGDKTFSPRVDYASMVTTRYVTLGDFNGDEIIDLCSIGGTKVAIFQGNGDGTFQSRTDYETGASAIWGAIGDVNNDGNMDVVVAQPTPRVGRIMLGSGDGSLTAAGTIYTQDLQSVSLSMADFNADGNIDFAAAHRTAGKVGMYYGYGDGTFSEGETFASVTSLRSVSVGDFDGDGISDVVTANGEASVAGTASVYLTNSARQRPFYIFSQEDALSAISTIDATLSRLSATLGNIGGTQRRMQAAAGTLGIARENFSAANSRIRDVDIASETSSLLRAQIMQQLGASLLASINRTPALALELLKG